MLKFVSESAKLVGIWEWYQRYTHDILAKNSPAHLNMLRLYEMSSLFGGAIALDMLQRARDEAQRLNEPCFSLFLSHWITEHLLWYKRSYQAALTNALEAVVQFGKITTDCPIGDRLYINLTEAYTEIDPAGYRQDILDSLAYVREHIPTNYESACMMAFRQGLMHARLNELAAAEEQANQCLAVVDSAAGADYYRVVGLFVLGLIAYQRNQMTRLRRIAALGTELAIRTTPPVYLVEFELWSAYAGYKLSDDATEMLYRSAINTAEATPEALSFAYYDTRCQWYLQHEKPEAVIALRKQQIERAHQRGAYLDAVEAGLDLLQLVLKLGENPNELVATIRVDLTSLRKPTPYQARLETILKT